MPINILKKIKIKLKAKLRPDRPGLAIEVPTRSAVIGSWLSWTLFVSKSPHDDSSIILIPLSSFPSFLFLIFFSCKNKWNSLSHCVRALSFTMISIGQYNNSSYLKYCLHVNIFVTHDELYFTKHVHSQKKTLSHTQSHKQTNKTTTTTSRSNLWCKL